MAPAGALTQCGEPSPILELFGNYMGASKYAYPLRTVQLNASKLVQSPSGLLIAIMGKHGVDILDGVAKHAVAPHLSYTPTHEDRHRNQSRKREKHQGNSDDLAPAHPAFLFEMPSRTPLTKR